MAAPNVPVEIEDLKTLVPSVSDAQAQIFISSADALVTDKGLSAVYPAATVYNIELYLAAHFASQATDNGGLIQVKVGNSEERYSDPSKTLYGIANTRWGQMALALDTKNLLADLAANPMKAQFKVYGTDSDADSNFYRGY